jgi:hypothetical protein
MVFNATFNNISVISWRLVLLVEETTAPGKNHWPVASHWQTLSHNVVSSTHRHEGFELTTLVVIGTDYTGSCKSNYHMITNNILNDMKNLAGMHFGWPLKFVFLLWMKNKNNSDWRQVGGFLPVLRFPPSIKLIATI